MNNLVYIGQKGTEAVRRLRKQKLDNGYPFMINSKELLSNQCYLEFPDGSIKLASIKKSSRDFDIIRELDTQETRRIRERFRFF